jgi:hypothetical protein
MNKHHGLSFGFAVQAAFCAAAIAAIFTLAGCPTEDDDPTPSVPSGNLGTTLSISGEQVYTASESSTEIKYTPITGNKTVTVTGVTGTASITGGKLNLTVTQAPSGTQLSPMSGMTDGLSANYNNVSVSPNDAKFAQLSLAIESEELSKSESARSQSSTAVTYTSKSVLYLYVDKAVIITGQGKTVTEDGTAITTQNITLNLAQGWNAVYSQYTTSISSSSYTRTPTVSVENPALKWSYEED